MGVRDVEGRVKRILTTKVGIPPEEIKLDARLSKDLEIDSLDVLQLVIAAEKEFAVAINEEQMAGLRTVADVVKLVERLAEDQAGRSSVSP